MILNAWQNADTNIQYRILNALIKKAFGKNKLLLQLKMIN